MNWGGYEKMPGRLFEKKTDWDKSHRYDSLTGLKNGLMLNEDYNGLSKIDDYVLVAVHLDGFYRLNSLFGLKLGGETIIRLCPILENFVKKYNGEVYRQSLDKFVLLLPVHDRRVFDPDIRQLFTLLEDVYVKDGEISYFYHYTFAYGIYYLSDKDSRAKSIQNILAIIDAAVSQLPRGKGSTGTVVNEKPDWELLDRFSKEIHSAWEARQFLPYYQMIYDIKTKKPAGAETLTRWDHPDHGIVRPDQFLPVMEREGLIADLDLYMLEEACRRIKNWIDKELVTVPISVNISKFNLYRRGFAEKMISIVDSYDVPPILLELELSENALVLEQSDTTASVLNKLHEYGFTLSLDNAGTDEYSSVNLIRKWPIDAVKLKPKFFNNVKMSNRDALFVSHSIAMAKEMGIRVIGMDVETQEQADVCVEMGCDLAQGYYFSKPEPQEQFEKEIF